MQRALTPDGWAESREAWRAHADEAR